MDWITQIDLQILHMIAQYMHTAWLDQFMIIFTTLGDGGALWIVMGIYLLFFKNYRKAGVAILLSLIVGFIVFNLGLKPMIARIRPFIVDPSFQLLISAPKDYSFPSGHAWSSFAMVAVLFKEKIKGRYWVMGVASLMAFSRLYMTVHYPTDVVAGIILGLAVGYASIYAVNKYGPAIMPKQWNIPESAYKSTAEVSKNAIRSK